MKMRRPKKALGLLGSCASWSLRELLAMFRYLFCFVALALLSESIKYSLTMENVESFLEVPDAYFSFDRSFHALNSTALTRSNGASKHRSTHSSHWCHSRDLLPDSGRRATCLFQNICVIPSNSSTHELEWLYVTPTANNSVNEAEISFSLGIGPHSSAPELEFHPTVLSQKRFESQFPDREYVTGLSTIYYEYNGENFGHVLTDVLLPVFVALEGMGFLDRPFNLIRLSLKNAIGYSCDFQKLDPNKAATAGPNCDRFYEMTPQMMFGHPPLQTLTARPSLKPTCFESALVGFSMNSDDCLEGSHGRTQNIWSTCNMARQAQFWRFREYILTNVGVSLEPPAKHKITITNPTGRRMLRYFDKLVEDIRTTFPHVEVVVVDWPKMTLMEQLDAIRTTTVHLTPSGGVSFIGMFLPKWATAIRLYSFEFKLEWHLFHYLGYMTVEHVECKDGWIPMQSTINYVEKALDRYDTYRVAHGPPGWSSSK